jgi:beta-glucosidase
MYINKESFGTDFNWGVSTAAFQIEGAAQKHGKGLSIWDDFITKNKSRLKNQHADIACDYYHKYPEDIYLIKSLNIPNYRFSLSWSRILPNGTGKINQQGIDFYKRIIDYCLELNIEPWITLYHWDLPLALQQKGGWSNRDVVDWFSDYVELCVKQFGYAVKNWIVLNEPMVFTGAGYFLGVHAPGIKNLEKFLGAVHHAALCQSAGAKIIKSISEKNKVGTSISYSHIEPYRMFHDKDEQAAKRVDAILNRLFLDPLVGRGYPINDLPFLNNIEKYIKQNDESNLSFDMDFIGLQNYTREMVKFSPIIPLVHAKIIKASKRKVDSYTLMDWEVYPRSIYLSLKRLNEYHEIKQIIITENGAAFTDSVHEGKINDNKRQKYIEDHIAQVYQAKKEGVKVGGYFVWTLTDNFEWAEGYLPKFGLIHVDFSTQKRTIKDSGHWYSAFLKNEKLL